MPRRRIESIKIAGGSRHNSLNQQKKGSLDKQSVLTLVIWQRKSQILVGASWEIDRQFGLDGLL